MMGEALEELVLAWACINYAVLRTADKYAVHHRASAILSENLRAYQLSFLLCGVIHDECDEGSSEDATGEGDGEDICVEKEEVHMRQTEETSVVEKSALKLIGDDDGVLKEVFLVV